MLHWLRLSAEMVACTLLLVIAVMAWLAIGVFAALCALGELAVVLSRDALLNAGVVRLS